jgi:hypothetical protein
VLDFPQYDLHQKMLDNPSLMLRNAEGKIVRMSGGGHSGMDVFDFSQAKARSLFISTCVNATKTGYVDGCFLDRAVDGCPTDSGNDNIPAANGRYKLNLTNETAYAYQAGHVQMLTDLQTAIGEGPVIANHAWGPPHDPVKAGAVSFAMIESFGANNASISQLRTAAKNQRGAQAHSKKVSTDTLAAFLIGAGYRAYFGTGGWGDADVSHHWSDKCAQSLGEPLADATLSGGVWSRQFAHGVNVTFDTKTNKGAITNFGPEVPTPSPPSPSPPTPPVPAPTHSCAGIRAGGWSGADISKTTASNWTQCCDDCHSTKSCSKWTWAKRNCPSCCHLHGADARSNLADNQYLSGTTTGH